MATKSQPAKVAIQLQGMMFVAAEARCDLRTVKRAYAGERLKGITYTRIVEAATKLKLPVPPDQP